jgi:hypothetical protein
MRRDPMKADIRGIATADFSDFSDVSQRAKRARTTFGRG